MFAIQPLATGLGTKKGKIKTNKKFEGTVPKINVNKRCFVAGSTGKLVAVKLVVS